MHALAALAASAALLPGFSVAGHGPAGGEVLTGTFPGGERPGYVYLPPGFSPARRYPVVYLLHGLPGSPSEYLNGAGLVRFADTEIARGRVRPFVAVMPAAGPRPRYNGEWAGPWETELVRGVLPWVDAHLPAIPAARDRVLAGLSAGGYGAADIGLRHPRLFGTIESWSGYFRPLRDGPFKHAGAATLAANDPIRLARSEASALRRDGVRFFLSTGPSHSHWFKAAATRAFARELRGLGLTETLRVYRRERGEWTAQLRAGLAWAFRA